MTFKIKTIMATSVCALALTACGGGGGGGGATPPPPPPDTTAPTVSFNPTSLTVASDATGTATLTATDNVGVTTGPDVTCTDGGSFSGSTFTAPAVTMERTITCTATAGDAAGNQGSAELTVTVTPPATVILEGTVYKGAISGATLGVLDGARPISDADAALDEGVTDADGGYSLVVPEGSQLSNLLVVSSLLAGAEMVCDAANCLDQGGINFGDKLLIPADTGPNAIKFLSAAVPTPAPVGFTEVNVNMFTHYQAMDMLGVSLARQGAGGEPILFLTDYDAARQSTAAIFGLPDADFFAIPYVDITQSITSTDTDAIYAALLSGGLLGAALEATDPFAAVLDFQERAVQDNLIAREGSNDPNRVSLEDIFSHAIAVGNQIAATGNAFTSAQTALSDRAALIAAASPDRAIAPDGSLPVLVTDLTFVADSVTYPAIEGTYVVEINNPDNLAFTAEVVDGDGSNLFQVNPTSAQSLILNVSNFGNDVPSGNYDLRVTFDTEFGDPFTDSLFVILDVASLDLVEESQTLSKSQTDRATFTLNNQGNYAIDIVSATGQGSELFLVEVNAAGDVDFIIDQANPPADGTYNFDVTITALPPGSSLPTDFTDTAEIIVGP